MIYSHDLNRNGRVVCSPADVLARTTDKRQGETTNHAGTEVTIRRPTSTIQPTKISTCALGHRSRVHRGLTEIP